MKRELYDEIGVGTVLVPTTVTATGASSWVDLAGYSDCVFLLRVEAVTGSGTLTPSIETGDTTGDSAATAAATGDTIGTVTAIDQDTDLVLRKIAYVDSGNHRYARLKYTVAGSFSATVTILAVVSGATSEPAADPTVAAAT